MVRIYRLSSNEYVYEDFLMTNEEGSTTWVSLEAPERDLSLEEANGVRPYETYNVELRHDGFETQEIIGVQIFAGEYTTLPIDMVPTANQRNQQENSIINQNNTTRLTNNQFREIRNSDYIVDQHLLTQYGGNNSGQAPQLNDFALRSVFIPTKITVHLGRPNAYAENFTCDFIYYLKNVASSEIYPTWPRAALEANIRAQISLALNRVYTEWYPSQGYNFNITNSTAFDQAFVKNRNIYDSVGSIVEEIFNEYLRKANYQEPYFAEYCDGKIAQCNGLKQWGTLTLANQGYSAIEILRYYYGNDIEIVESNNIQDIKASYPGTPLRVGDAGTPVLEMQELLNGIAVNYPSIKPIFPLNGVFGTNMEDSVKTFQRIFNLTPDGIIGKGTWYKISYIYVAVRKLAELTSLGRIEGLISGEFPGRNLSEGDKGVEVQQLQYYLSVIATFIKEIPPVVIDSRFGRTTEQAVLAFQRKYGLIQDGVVGISTWDRIYQVFQQLENEVIPDDLPPEYPGRAIGIGASGDDVAAIQNAINVVSSQYSSVDNIVADGYFGPSTQNAVKQFQTLFGLFSDGIVGEFTWNRLFTVANQIQSGDRPNQGLPPFPGPLLRLGSTGSSVTFIQERLKTISIYYKSIPDIRVDSIYGTMTQIAVQEFQKLVGLPVDGVVGQATWNQINRVYNELINQ